MTRDTSLLEKDLADDVVTTDESNTIYCFSTDNNRPRNPMVVPDQRDKFTYANRDLIGVISHIVQLTDLEPGWCHGHEVPPSKKTAAFAVHALQFVPDVFCLYSMPGDNNSIIISAMRNDFCVEIEVTFGSFLNIGVEKGIGNIYDDLGHTVAPTYWQITAVFDLINTIIDTKNYDKENTEHSLKQIFSSRI